MINISSILRAAVVIPPVILLPAIVALGAPAHSPSDGTLEEAYAKQCADHQDTQLCRSLATAMESAAKARPQRSSPSASEVSVPNDQAWGLFAKLADTSWLDPTSGAVLHFAWVRRGEVMEWTTRAVQGVGTARMAIDASGRVMIGASPVRPEAPDRVVIGGSEFGWRQYVRATGSLISVREEELKDGSWIALDPQEWQLLPEAGVSAAIAALVPRQNAYRAEVAARQAEAAAKTVANVSQNTIQTPAAPLTSVAASPIGTLGVLPELVGSMWTNGTLIFHFYRDADNDLWIARYQMSGEPAGHWVFMKKRSGKVYALGNGTTEFFPDILPNGDIFLDDTDDALLMRDANSFMWENGRMRNGAYERSDRQDTGWNGVFQRFAPAQVQAFRAQLRRYEQQASSSDSGLMGALAMGAGAMLAGGNTEQVMGMAMKGAELTTDNEMSRNVLAGQGDAMVAAGTQRLEQQAAMRAESFRNDTGGRTAANTPSTTRAASGISGPSAGTQPGPRAMATMVTRFTFCVELRSNRGDPRPTLYHSRVGPVSRRSDEYFRDTIGFSEAVDATTSMSRTTVGANCPHFATRDAAEADLRSKLGYGNPSVHVQDYVPR